MNDTPSAFFFLAVGPLIDDELSLRLAKTSSPDPANQRVATYHFELRIAATTVGTIRFRAENHFDVETYAGNIGYNVHPAFRGNHLAERACRLLLPLARAHGFTHLWITCDPDNLASRRTCERLGAELIDIVAAPENGAPFKCRYRLLL